MGSARVLQAAGRPGEAEPLVLEAHGIFQSALGPDHARTLEAIAQLASVYDTLGRPADAASWRARLPASATGG